MAITVKLKIEGNTPSQLIANSNIRREWLVANIGPGRFGFSEPGSNYTWAVFHNSGNSEYTFLNESDATLFSLRFA